MAEFIKISQVEEGTRLLRWFVRHFPGMPQRDFYKLCRGGQIRINSSRCKGLEILNNGDIVRVPPTLQSYKQIIKHESGDVFSLEDLESLRMCIIYNDEDIVVFNKPAGLSVQGGTGIKKSIDKMAAALFPYDKISLVHRLDKETSGILVVAKNQRAAQELALQFQNKTARKEYIALLYGNITKKEGIIDNYIIKNGVVDHYVKNIDGYKPQRAITEYKVLSEISNGLSWVLFVPKTGRTHQLRLHSTYVLQSPIVGDFLYGYNKNIFAENFGSLITTNNLFLFAYKLTFVHPSSKKNITLCAELPNFMQSIAKLLEFKLP